MAMGKTSGGIQAVQSDTTYRFEKLQLGKKLRKLYKIKMLNREAERVCLVE